MLRARLSHQETLSCIHGGSIYHTTLHTLDSPHNCKILVAMVANFKVLTIKAPGPSSNPLYSMLSCSEITVCSRAATCSVITRSEVTRLQSIREMTVMQRSMLMQTDLHHLKPSKKTKMSLKKADHQGGQQMVSTSCWRMPRK